MDDRELLELAAKAAGIEVIRVDEPGLWIAGGAGVHWNPLTDDGDALRLAVKLNFEIERSRLADRAYVGSVGDAPWVEYVNDEQDIYECTRRAIVRAAAEIGRAM